MDTIYRIRKYSSSTDRSYLARSIGNSWISCPKNRDRSIKTLNAKTNFILENCIVKVVCLAEDENNIVAFMVIQPVEDDLAILHSLFVRGYYRQQGIATSLLRMLSKKYPKIGISMDFVDSDKILPLMSKMFDLVVDKTSLWGSDRMVSNG